MKNIAKVGIVGCGNISEIYLKNLAARFPRLRAVACADRIAERAEAKAAAFSLKALGVDELLASEEIDIVLNLTIPLAHAELSLAALRAGKHVYSEKPLAATRADGARIMAEAAARSLLIGCAPDTFLGAGIAACRSLIDSGAIGTPVGGTANMLCPGHERLHPDPAFYYAPGGGPVLDMGPYYLTALVELLGPIAGVSACASKAYDERVVGSGPKKGDRIPVLVSTHVAGLLRFAAGPVVALTMSFDVQASRLPPIEIWGTEGSLAVPDPNSFGGPVLLRKRGGTEWEEQQVPEAWSDNSRGLGVADLAGALLDGTPQRASGLLAFHVLDAMEALAEAARERREIDVSGSGGTILRP